MEYHCQPNIVSSEQYYHQVRWRCLLLGAGLLLSFMTADSTSWAFIFPAPIPNVAGADIQFNVANVGYVHDFLCFSFCLSTRSEGATASLENQCTLCSSCRLISSPDACSGTGWMQLAGRGSAHVGRERPRQLRCLIHWATGRLSTMCISCLVVYDNTPHRL